MLTLLPLLTYVVALLLVGGVLRGIGFARRHVLFWMFAAYSAPYALRFALQTSFAFPFSSVELLSSDEFIWTTLALGVALVAAAIVYRLTYQMSLAAAARDEERAARWIAFTDQWGVTIYRYLWLVTLACTVLGLFIRYVVQGERFALGFVADIESRHESMGWSFVPFIVSQITLAIILVAIELRRPRREVLVLFAAQILLAVSSGSKGGFLIPLVYCLAFAIHRGRVRMSARTWAIVGAVSLVSLVIGITVRGWIEDGVLSAAAASSPAALFGPAIGRFFAFDLMQIMIAQPATYASIIGEYRAYAVSAVVPAALWPAKPLNPCLLLGESVGFPFVTCVAPGWVGGVLILLGPIGLLLAPLLVGVVTARIAWRAHSRADAASFRHPLTFMVGLLWLGLVDEGVYYQAIPIFLPILLALVLVYVGTVLLNGRMGSFPAFASRP